MNNERKYTIAKCFFEGKDKRIIRKFVMDNLEPMTIKEAQTMITKQTNPVEWIPVELKLNMIDGE